MTPAERKRYASECRNLAMECVNGTAPEIGVGSVYAKPPCAIGIICERAGGKRDYIAASGSLYTAMWDVIEANDIGAAGERKSRLVFPLLALADELEAA